ncbi:hypothetical protein [Bradyrhizobium sp. SZCCHNS3002]|uniref:hypothetical protein n=1 Tax=Bradyrhizobium sp. SZCCHNS3002 TaxID=3057310 RepID=UPI0028E6935A|nr:hypothetical protein [Bradyrhizobium sp. SZCCHNS3002]
MQSIVELGTDCPFHTHFAPNVRRREAEHCSNGAFRRFLLAIAAMAFAAAVRN